MRQMRINLASSRHPASIGRAPKRVDGRRAHDSPIALVAETGIHRLDQVQPAYFPDQLDQFRQHPLGFEIPLAFRLQQIH